MSRFTLPDPTTKIWSQPNAGDIFGQLWATFNIDLETVKGKLLTSRQMSVITDGGTANFSMPTALVRSDADGTDRYWLLAGRLFKTAGIDPSADYAIDAISGTPAEMSSLYSDLEEWEGDLIACGTKTTNTADDIDKLSGGTWINAWWSSTLGQTKLTQEIYHPIKKIFNGLLLIGDGRYVHTVRRDDSGTDVASYKRLILPKEFRVNWIISSNGRAWIGAINLFGGAGAVFEWNGSDDNYTSPSPYETGHPKNLSGVIKDGIPYCVTGDGLILKFNGSGFEEFARFPVANKGVMDDSGAVEINWDTTDPATPVVHQNGMDIVDDKIHLVLRGGIGNSAFRLLENFLGGVWVVNARGSCYHKHSFQQIKDGGTRVDYGAEVVSIPGFLKATYDENKFVCGARTFTDDGSTGLSAIYEIEPAPAGNRGYFITPQLPVSEVEDIWKVIWLKFRKLEDANDRIVIKYRVDTEHALDFRMKITWTAANVFTTEDASGPAANMANVQEGDEVEVSMGSNAGGLAHVSGTPVKAGNIYTVTLDESLAKASGTGQCRFKRWTKLKEISDQTIKNDFAHINKEAQWIQFKIELRADMNSGERGILLEEIIIDSEPSLKVK